MGKRSINGMEFASMVMSGANVLERQVETVNEMNVFPVPDGDTGTNMNLTIKSGMHELNHQPSNHIGKAAETLSKGLLMGARGNSGVILSQLFRGFAKSVAGLEEVDTNQFAAALLQGVETAYQAVVRPVEGTILTVSKETAKHAVICARRTDDLAVFMQEVFVKAQETLDYTPELLPVLKQVGVVDSGGQGLVFIYEGFLSFLTGGTSGLPKGNGASFKKEELSGRALQKERTSAQSKIATEDIEFRYDMEFFIDLSADSSSAALFDDGYFRKELEKDGNSILVVVNDDLVKVHVHSKAPGKVLELALNYGELSKIQIENMRDQHRNLLSKEDKQLALKPFGMVAVGIGEGIEQIFKSLGVDGVLSGGQTMNPSTEDIVNAVNQIKAQTVFVFPNNSNIILAAQQAVDLTDKEVIVIPTKTIPQGISAALAFQEASSAGVNQDSMLKAISQVRSGQVTWAVRDTQIDHLEIKEGDYIGLLDNKIVTSAADLLEVCQQLLGLMISTGDEILTVLTGLDITEQQSNELENCIKQNFNGVEMEIHSGGQPVYLYIFSVE
ncbi:MAG TPA: DAK2 domain-containing protein [Bacilli bacterium]